MPDLATFPWQFEIGAPVFTTYDPEKQRFKVVDRLISVTGVETYLIEGEYCGTKYSFYLEHFCLESADPTEEAAALADRIDLINRM